MQTDQSLCNSLECSMAVKLLIKQHLEFLSLKGGNTCSSESTLVKIPHCWKSHVTAQLLPKVTNMTEANGQLHKTQRKASDVIVILNFDVIL